MADRLERFINLISKTGDRLIVYDRQEPENSFVVINFNEYERLLSESNSVKGLTEDELIDKINRDIALWKEEQVTEPPSEAVSSFTPASPNQGKTQKPKNNNWTIPAERRRETE